MKKAENIIVGISIGDLNGIGSEVVLKTFDDSRMLELCTPVIFANVKVMSFIKKTLELEIPLHGIDQIDQIVPGKVNVLNIWREGVDLNFGANDPIIGKYAIKSFVAATKALKENQIDVLVTAPINKYNIQSEEFKFPGHTDYLDKELEGNALMLMVQDNLRVGLLTDHIPVNDVAKHLTEKLIIQKIETIKQTLIQDFGINKPKIASSHLIASSLKTASSLPPCAPPPSRQPKSACSLLAQKVSVKKRRSAAALPPPRGA